MTNSRRNPPRAAKNNYANNLRRRVLSQRARRLREQNHVYQLFILSSPSMMSDVIEFNNSHLQGFEPDLMSDVVSSPHFSNRNFSVLLWFYS